MQILKGTGEYEEFNPEKLKESLLRVSTSLLTAKDVVSKVRPRIKDGMTTDYIYKIAFEILNKKEKRSAMRYSIKRSILELGPTGFPFEKFIAEIFKKKGYRTETGITLPGSCVSHEIDVLAYDEEDLILVEVKFHNALHLKSDTKTALYVKARWDDLKEKEIITENNRHRKPNRFVLITNTKFTNNSEKYGKCVGLGMISWGYPKKGNLYDLVLETKLHPITIINSLSNYEKELLIKNDIITANQIIETPFRLKEIGFNKNKIQKILNEAKIVCELI